MVIGPAFLTLERRKIGEIIASAKLGRKPISPFDTRLTTLLRMLVFVSNALTQDAAQQKIASILSSPGLNPGRIEGPVNQITTAA